jgi:subtilisin family serine protease
VYIDDAAVRCIDCNGDSAVDDIIAGLEWVAGNFQLPAVASMSLGTSGANDALDAAVLALIDLGVTATVAAGNFGTGETCYMSCRRQVSGCCSRQVQGIVPASRHLSIAA